MLGQDQLSNEDRRIPARNLTSKEWDAVSEASTSIVTVDVVTRGSLGSAPYVEPTSSQAHQMILVAFSVALVAIALALEALEPLTDRLPSDQSG